MAYSYSFALCHALSVGFVSLPVISYFFKQIDLSKRYELETCD